MSASLANERMEIMIDATLQGDIERFQDLQRKLSFCGANDSEPRNIFFDLMENAVLGEADLDIDIPFTPEGWELFADKTGAKSGARMLARQARTVVDRIQNMMKAAQAARVTVENFTGRF